MARPQTALALSTTPAVVSANPVRVMSIYAYHGGTGNAYVQMFNAKAAADVTLGTTVPDAAFGMATLKNVALSLGDGILFSKGLVVASTTTATGSSATNGAQDVTFGLNP